LANGEKCASNSKFFFQGRIPVRRLEDNFFFNPTNFSSTNFISSKKIFFPSNQRVNPHALLYKNFSFTRIKTKIIVVIFEADWTKILSHKNLIMKNIS